MHGGTCICIYVICAAEVQVKASQTSIRHVWGFRTWSVQVIPAFEEAMVGMKVGGVRRLIVPQELGYPGQPPDFTKQGPTPGNFSVSPPYC